MKGVRFVAKTSWKTIITKQMSALNIKTEPYKPVIATLCDILEQRDAVYAQYIDEGAQPVREYTNKAGATNLTKNPLLILWDDLNKSALAYWRDLGLTPSSYKKLAAETQPEKKSALTEALSKLDG